VKSLAIFCWRFPFRQHSWLPMNDINSHEAFAYSSDHLYKQAHFSGRINSSKISPRIALSIRANRERFEQIPPRQWVQYWIGINRVRHTLSELCRRLLLGSSMLTNFPPRLFFSQRVSSTRRTLKASNLLQICGGRIHMGVNALCFPVASLQVLRCD
jgi:hypothetical protein